jgi:hypothetical protein
VRGFQLPGDTINHSGDKDLYFRSTLSDDPSSLGPLYRHTTRVTITQHATTTVSITNHINQLIIPDSLISTTLYMFHEGMGHPGRRRTLATIRQSHFWLSMDDDVTNHIRKCHFCKVRKADNQRGRLPIMEYPTSYLPMDRCHMDLTGPFPTSTDGNKYILVFKDALTKYIRLIPLSDKSGEVVLSAVITHIFHVLGYPTLLITDRGTEFTNEAMQYFNSQYEIHHVKTTPANPRSDGLAENAMRTIKDMLACYTNSHHTNWDTHLSNIANLYNNTVNDATGYTPYYLLFGRHNRFLADDRIFQKIPVTIHQYARDMTAVMQNIWLTIGERVVRNVQIMNRVPRSHLPFKVYSVGDRFFHRRVPRRFYRDQTDERSYKLSSKLQNRWTGPYRITRCISPVLYEADIHNEIKRVHAINMRPF